MEFIFSLTHFCEAHGPRAIFCTQVRLAPCAICDPSSPDLRTRPSNASFDTEAPTARDSPSTVDGLQHTTSQSLSSQFSRTSTAVGSIPPTPSIENTPYYVNGNKNAEQQRSVNFAPSQGDTCASCTFSVPEDISKQLPANAPGSPRLNGPGSNGSPVLRSRQMISSCTIDPTYSSTFDNPTDRRDRGCSHSHLSTSTSTTSSSLQSFDSEESEHQCHPHEAKYLTVKAPEDPTEYKMLRAAVIRSLSSEQLPRGLSSGPIVVGDSTNGYTIAHQFRLPDPKARGRRRAYAFVALAGRDGHRALRAFPIISAAFSRLAEKLIHAAERHQEEQRRKEEMEEEVQRASRKYTPVSSFLNPRVIDADGLPRRVGQSLPRSLADITGNPRIFAEIHAEFCLTLCVLGKGLKWLPKEESMTYETPVVAEHSPHRTFRSQVEQQGTKGLGLRSSPSPSTTTPAAIEISKLRDLDATPKPPKQGGGVEVEAALSRMSVNSNSHNNSQSTTSIPQTTSPTSPCTPISLDAQRRRQQVMV